MRGGGTCPQTYYSNAQFNFTFTTFNKLNNNFSSIL